MKLSKLLLTSALVVAPITTIAPAVVSCNKHSSFEAYAENKHFTTSERTITVPLSFSYSPSEPVIVQLQGDIEGLSCPETIKVINNKADLTINISAALSKSKLFNFNIQFTYDILSLPFVLKDFYVVYQYEPPKKDTVVLRTPSIVETTENECTFKIQFSAEPTSTGGNIGTQLAIKTFTTDRLPIYYEETQKIQVEGTKYYLYFKINTYSGYSTTYFFSVFDLILEFQNSYGYDQMEVIPNCTYTHLI